MSGLEHCTHITCRLPLHYVWKWSPFHIDALGIVTMIGAEQVNQAVGRLVTSRFAEYLPLLGAYAIASNGFTDAYSGFAVYNISAGIMTTDMAGWFARWCLAQDFSRGCSSVTWTIDEDWSSKKREDRQNRALLDTYLALLIGVSLNGFLIAFTALQGDWWGLANAISMIISIVVRWYVAKKNRDAIDSAVKQYKDQTVRPRPMAKCFVTFNDGKQINMYAPASLVKWIFIDKPMVKDNPKSLYFVARMAGWIGFAAHVITIGQSGLATQIVTVFIIVVSTVLTVFKAGCDDNFVGSKLHADITRPQWRNNPVTGKVEQSIKRRDAFIYLRLDEKEETMMRKWAMMPLKHDGSEENKRWWKDYEDNKSAWLGTNPLPPPPAPVVQVMPPSRVNTAPVTNGPAMPLQNLTPTMANTLAATLTPKPANVSTISVSSGSGGSGSSIH